MGVGQNSGKPCISAEEANGYGPKLISLALAQRAEAHDVMLEFIKPGKPTQNVFIERFNRTFRTEYWIFICSER